MQISDWIPFYKYADDGSPNCMSQQTYEPLISPDGKTFCANYDWQNEYQRISQPDRTGYTQEIVNYFFDKEVEYATRFSKHKWAPVILEIDNVNKRVFYEWNGPTCNEIIYSGGELPSNWRNQLRNIMLDAYTSGVYKLTMYPHCHFFDKEGVMHTIDMYGCVEVNDPFIETKYMDGIIHSTAQFRLDETGKTANNKYNMELMFKGSLGKHVNWGTEKMQYIYTEIFANG
jgi:hypothetical protein